MKKIKVFESFSGYGSQSISLRDMDINHEVVKISEIEPDAIIAYGSIRFNLDDLHTDKTHDEMRKELMDKNVGWDFQKKKSKIPRMKKDKLEMLYKFDKASNNFGDISIINPNELPNFDYFTYSFPCQSLSISGKQEGLVKGGTRSGLLYECEKIIETKKPKYLLMENVKNLVSKKFINDFNKWLEYLESLGYKNYWKVLNAKDFGIAQNRERVFCVSILGEHEEYEFPKGEKLTKRLKDFLEGSVDEKYYLSEDIQKRFKQTKIDNGDNNVIGTTAPEFRTIGQRDLVYGNESCANGTLVATDYKQPKQIIDYSKDKPHLVGGFGDINFGKQYRQGNRVYDSEGIAMCLCSSPIGNTGGNSYLYKVDNCSNGAIRGRYDENGNIEQQLELRDDGVDNTITTVQKDNVLVEKADRLGGCFDTENIIIDDTQGYDGVRYYDEYSPTLRSERHGLKTYQNFRIRKLTPKECLRLMGVSDTDISRMQSVGLSDSSLYKLAGNSIVKQCLDVLHINMFLSTNKEQTPS